MKRKLEKLEAVARSSQEHAPTEPRGYAVKYLRELVVRAERGELPKVKLATDEKKSETWLELEVATVANRLRRRAQSEGANLTVRDSGNVEPKAKSPDAEDELPEELLLRLSRLVSQKVH